MISKHLSAGILMASVAMTPASQVTAGGSDIAGGIIGGIIGGVIVNEGIKHRSRKRTVVRRRAVTPRRSKISNAARAQNREIQTSLNYFGFPAGAPDGIFGRKSRSAVSSYQAYMGYGPTGQLTTIEKDFLVNSYHRAQAGGYTTQQLINDNGQGAKGLLMAYRGGQTGVATSNTQMAATAPQPVTPTVQTSTPALPNFMAGSTADTPSLASHCNQISLLTNSNGGFTTLASLSDPEFALNEQFCLARTYAIAQGEDMARGLQGVTSAQLEGQCAAFGPMLKPHVAALSLKPHDQVMQDVSSFVLTTGMTPQQLIGTAKICLSVGYRTDNQDVALGSALLLTTLGEQPYSELLGHHLTQGFGVSARPDLALAWYKVGLDAVAAGQPAVFAPGNPERAGLIQKAAFQLNGVGDQTNAAAGQETVQPASTLPTFLLNGDSNN